MKKDFFEKITHRFEDESKKDLENLNDQIRVLQDRVAYKQPVLDFLSSMVKLIEDGTNQVSDKITHLRRGKFLVDYCEMLFDIDSDNVSSDYTLEVRINAYGHLNNNGDDQRFINRYVGIYIYPKFSYRLGNDNIYHKDLKEDVPLNSPISADFNNLNNIIVDAVNKYCK